MSSITVLKCLVPALMLLAGCGGSEVHPEAAAPLSADDVNLIFVVSPDLVHHAEGDIQPDTANLTPQGLQRSLLMASYLKEQVLGSTNATGIYALAPMTHLQTANRYPNMAAIGYIQPFALLNQITIKGTTAYSFPIHAAYAPGDVPAGVVEPNPYKPGAQGLAFDDMNANNVALASRIIDAHVAGFHVFSAPWETIRALLVDVNFMHGFDLEVPTAYRGPNTVYALSVEASGRARLVALDSDLDPPGSYPVLPLPLAAAACTKQPYFSITRTAGLNGVVVPEGMNTNQTVYLMRHTDAHPADHFEDGNYVGTGQWRALALPDVLPKALRGLPRPTLVYSIDPAQSFALSADFSVSYVRPSLTVLPYVIAHNLPYKLIADFYMGAATDQAVAKATSDFLFTGGHHADQTILLAWEREHLPPLVTYLIQSYGGTVPVPALAWPQDDYDTIWTVRLDAEGNLTVDNALCQGIDSASLPPAPPPF